MRQRLALPKHSCKPLCPGCSEFRIAAEIKVRQRWALRQQSCKPLCSGCSEAGAAGNEVIFAEIKVVSQRWALCQHSCKPLCIL